LATKVYRVLIAALDCRAAIDPPICYSILFVAKPETFCKALYAMRTITAIISVEKLTANAIAPLTAALKQVPGVQSIDFSLERSVAVVEFDGGEAKVDDLLRAVQQAGYQVL